jgi:hypothetical protein
MTDQLFRDDRYIAISFAGSLGHVPVHLWSVFGGGVESTIFWPMLPCGRFLTPAGSAGPDTDWLWLRLVRGVWRLHVPAIRPAPQFGNAQKIHQSVKIFWAMS